METTYTLGAFSPSAPTPVLSRKFTRILGEPTTRPAKLEHPPYALRRLFGDMGDELLLSGQLALPTRLQEAGYRFKFSELDDALIDILP